MIFFPILTIVVAIVLIITSLRALSLSRRLKHAEYIQEEQRTRAHAALDSATASLIAFRKSEENVIAQRKMITDLMTSNNRLEERLNACQTEKYGVFNNLANVIAEKAEVEKQYITLNEQLKTLLDQRRPRTVSHKPAKQQ
jgi:hypothetical protein